MISIHLIAQSSSLNIHETIWVRHLSMKIHFWVVIRPLLQAMNFIAKIEIFSEFSSLTERCNEVKTKNSLFVLSKSMQFLTLYVQLEKYSSLILHYYSICGSHVSIYITCEFQSNFLAIGRKTTKEHLLFNLSNKTPLQIESWIHVEWSDRLDTRIWTVF